MPRFTDAAAHLLWGSVCAGCGVPAANVCDACRLALVPAPRVVWPDPVPSGLAGTSPYAAARYEGILRQVIVDFKEHGRFTLAPVLAPMLAASVRAAVDDRLTPTLVPVPSSRRAVRLRGFDALDLLTVGAARVLRREGHPVRVRRVLHHVRSVHDQSDLDAAGRAANLRGALEAYAHPLPRPLVVVDDILTTGSTTAEAVRALVAQGHRVHAVAVIAATPRVRPSPP